MGHRIVDDNLYLIDLDQNMTVFAGLSVPVVLWQIVWLIGSLHLSNP
jgi:hypothetical protein